MGLKGPSIGINAPQVKLQAPQVEAHAPQVGLHGPELHVSDRSHQNLNTLLNHSTKEYSVFCFIRGLF